MNGETKMTLIVAICTVGEEGEGIVICSDSQATVGPVTYRVHKIVPIRQGIEPLALAAGAGDTALIKKAIDSSKKILTKNSVREWNGKTPSFDQFKETVPEIESSLVKKISFYKDRELTVNFDFLLGSVDSQGKTSLYVFDSRGIAQSVHDDPGFACIGSGFYLGGNLLLQQFSSPNLDLDEACDLAAYVINQVSRVDAGVGPFEGDSWYFCVRKNKGPFLGELSKKGFRMMKSEYEGRRKLLKYVWKHSDVFGAKGLYKIIQAGIKEKKKELRKKAKKGKT